MTLFNVIQHTQITPHGWHIDLVYYVQRAAATAVSAITGLWR